MSITSETKCVRCRAPGKLGTPDTTKRAIVAATSKGFCSNCMITHFLLGVEPIRDSIEGTQRNPGLGPEIFLDSEWREKVLRPVMRGILAHTQMPEDSINWIEVVGNWGMPWPKGKSPDKAAY